MAAELHHVDLGHILGAVARVQGGRLDGLEQLGQELVVEGDLACGRGEH